jgi:hypothetical protein
MSNFFEQRALFRLPRGSLLCPVGVENDSLQQIRTGRLNPARRQQRIKLVVAIPGYSAATRLQIIFPCACKSQTRRVRAVPVSENAISRRLLSLLLSLSGRRFNRHSCILLNVVAITNVDSATSRDDTSADRDCFRESNRPNKHELVSESR